MTGRPEVLGPLVSTDWLARQMEERPEEVRVVDCRWYLAPFDTRDPDGEYARAHIPGAVQLRWDTHWADPSNPVPGMLAPPERFAEAMSAAGIGDETTVVAYDDGHVTVAARLWWALRVYGHNAVAVLNGGITRWQAEGRPLSTEVAAPRRRCFSQRERSPAYATASDVLNAQAEGEIALVDCRMAEAREEDGAAIAGSVAWLPGIEFLGDDGMMRSPEDCRAQILAAADRSAKTILYCRGGVGACGTALAYEVAGLGEGVSVYDGSWLEWTALAEGCRANPEEVSSVPREYGVEPLDPVSAKRLKRASGGC